MPTPGFHEIRQREVLFSLITFYTLSDMFWIFKNRSGIGKRHPKHQKHQKHPAGWETARGGSMTSCKYLSTDLNTLTVVYACWGNNLGSKSCYLQWGKILSNILVVNAILREGNILLEGLEFDYFFCVFA